MIRWFGYVEIVMKVCGNKNEEAVFRGIVG